MNVDSCPWLVQAELQTIVTEGGSASSCVHGKFLNDVEAIIFTRAAVSDTGFSADLETAVTSLSVHVLPVSFQVVLSFGSTRGRSLLQEIT